LKVLATGLSLKEIQMSDAPKLVPVVEIAKEINRLHKLAFEHATSAVQYATDVGQLLLQIKSKLPHGEFTPWIEANIMVSPRQAQRYMAVAQGKKVSIRELAQKSDIVSDSKKERHDKLMELYENPPWIPAAKSWNTGFWDNAVYHVIPDINNPEFFHISKLYQVDGLPFDIDLEGEEADKQDDKSRYDGTQRSVHPKSVAVTLYAFGLTYPEKIDWDSEEDEGMERPFCEPLSLRLKMKKHHD
jgi:hypothetical protein